MYQSNSNEEEVKLEEQKEDTNVESVENNSNVVENIEQVVEQTAVSDVKTEINNSGKDKIKIVDQKTVKATVIILIVFFILSILATGVLIYFQKYAGINIVNVYDEQNLITQANNQDFIVKDLTETYNQNSITFKEGTTTFDGNSPDVSAENNLYKAWVKYTIIQGLKNKEVENKINEIIKQKSQELIIQKDLADKNIKRINVSTAQVANFANVLSIISNKYYEYAEGVSDTYNPSNYEIKAVNLRIDTGEEIKFKDLFAPNTDIKSIVMSALYDKLAWDYRFKFLQEPGTLDFNKVDYSQIEDEIFLLASNYDENQDFSFYFTPKTIYVKINDYADYIPIDMMKNMEYISIYNKYKTETSLFADDSIGMKNIFVFSDRFAGDYSIFEQVLDNLFIDVSGFTTLYDGANYDTKTLAANKIEEKLNEIKNYAKNNLNKGIIFQIDCYAGFYYNQLSINIQVYRYEMSIEYFDKNWKSLVSSYYRTNRQSTGSSYFIKDRLEYPNITYTTFSETYNYDTNYVLLEKITRDENWQVIEDINYQVNIYGVS